MLEPSGIGHGVVCRLIANGNSRSLCGCAMPVEADGC